MCVLLKTSLPFVLRCLTCGNLFIFVIGDVLQDQYNEQNIAECLKRLGFFFWEENLIFVIKTSTSVMWLFHRFSCQ